MNVALTSSQKTALEDYANLLRKWNKNINLVSSSTIDDLWERHIVDSLQLLPHIPLTAESILDIGSGGGLPGVVLAVMLQERNVKVTLVDRDRRKCVFLSQVSRALGLSLVVECASVESLPHQAADVITARALAPLRDLLTWSQPHLATSGRCLFLKGRTWKTELDAVREEWHVSVNAVPSQTDPAAAILDIGQMTRA